MILNKKLEGNFNSKLQTINLNQNYWLQGLNGSALSFFIQSLYLTQKKNCVIIATDKEKAAYLLNDLETLLPQEKILFFPESYRQPYQIEKTTNANIQETIDAVFAYFC